MNTTTTDIARNTLFKYLAVICLIFASAVPANGFVQDGIMYKIIDDHNVAVVYKDNDEAPEYHKYQGHITIPEKVNYDGKDYTVTVIAESCFYKSQISGISLPNTIRTIEESAFAYCDLETVKLGDSITEIPPSAFYGCGILQSVKFGNRLISIGEEAFRDCRRLMNLEFPDSLRIIGEEAFEGCNSLETVYLPDSLEELGRYAFDYCKHLTVLSISSKTQIEGGKLPLSMKVVKRPTK